MTKTRTRNRKPAKKTAPPMPSAEVYEKARVKFLLAIHAANEAAEELLDLPNEGALEHIDDWDYRRSDVVAVVWCIHKVTVLADGFCQDFDDYATPAYAAGGRPGIIGEGKELALVRWPVAGEAREFWLNIPQCQVVRKLLRALQETSNPEVKEWRLLRAAGSSAESLHELFAGHVAWGVLVVPGQGDGTYRLAPVEETPVAATA